MASARSEAIKQLGSENDYINAKAYANERTNAQNTYNTNYNNLQNQYNQLLADTEKNKLAAKKDFSNARHTVDTDAYMRNRGVTGTDLSNRANSSGLGSLSQLGSAIQRNKSNSDIANTYYNSMADIMTKLDRGTETHNYNMDMLKNNLNDALANINAREAEQRNAYRQAVAALAEQIANRWAVQAQTTAFNNAQKEAAKRENLRLLADKYKAAINGSNDINVITKVMQDAYKNKELSYIDNAYKTYADVIKFFNDYGVYRQSDVEKKNKEDWAKLQAQKAKQNQKSNVFAAPVKTPIASPLKSKR